jgi:hypothetical protein
MMLEKNELLELLHEIYVRLDHNDVTKEFIAEVELKIVKSKLSGSDIINFCKSDYPVDTIADIVIGFSETQKKLNYSELIQITEIFRFGESSEAEDDLLYHTFVYNCSHPAGGDLLLDQETYFGTDSPTAKQIVDLALKKDG